LDIKNEILWRIYLVALLFILFAVGIFVKTAQIQFVEGEKWRARADSLYVAYRPVSADRGNIYADDGSLLATSLPTFDIYMDCKSEAMSDELFNKHVDTLAQCLSTLADSEFTAGGYKRRLNHARKENERYLLIKKKVSYPEMQRIKTFPLYNLGRYRGGLIIERRSERQRPFRMLAHRTIGYVRENIRPVGLEGSFDETLAGEQGQRLMQRIAGGTWIPINDLTEVEPKNGKDIVTTLNVNIQDVTEDALQKAIIHHNADHGCAIVMEVATGKVKAIANIGVAADGNLWETYNFAVGESTEPGSTMKLASMIALLEDGYVSPEDSIDLNYGKMEFAGEQMEDASIHGLKTTTVQRAFEISSNVGIASMVYENYRRADRETQFIDHLKRFHLGQKTGIEIEGEGEPYIKNVGTDDWSAISLAWMSTGYELRLTPLQMLTFYNGVANDGKIMKPYIVEKIEEYGRSIEEFKPQILQNRIASSTTIDQVQDMLLGVVERGTARKIKFINFRMAGKTGTAITNYRRGIPANQRKYQASFAGYFPAENPKYSCIVVVRHPKQNGIYGSQVAAPVFREIAERCFASYVDLHAPINDQPKPDPVAVVNMPRIYNGYTNDLEKALMYLDLPVRSRTASGWSSPQVRRDSLELRRLRGKRGTTPDVRGMGIRDAMYLLGNAGLTVKIQGIGRVTTQSILPGTPTQGQTIYLELKL